MFDNFLSNVKLSISEEASLYTGVFIFSKFDIYLELNKDAKKITFCFLAKLLSLPSQFKLNAFSSKIFVIFLFNFPKS